MKRHPAEELHDDLEPAGSGGLTPGKRGRVEARYGAGRTTDGHGLPAPLQTSLEGALGVGLGGVRLHTDAHAAQAARAMNARALAINENIIFGAGQYQPDTDDGRFLLAHEVAHTVQQGPGAAAQAKPLDVTGHADASEREADRFAFAYIAGRGEGPMPQVSRGLAPAIARIPGVHDSDGVRADAASTGRDYFERHEDTIITNLMFQLHQVQPPAAPPVIGWYGHAGMVLGQAVWKRLVDSAFRWLMLQGYLTSPLAAVINNSRGAAADGEGKEDYDPAVCTELASLLRVAIIEAVGRMLPSYMRARQPLMLEAELAKENPAEVQPSAEVLDRIRPIDWPVAEALCSGIVIFDVAAYRATMPGGPTSAPVASCVEGDDAKAVEPITRNAEHTLPAGPGRDALALSQIDAKAKSVDPAAADKWLRQGGDIVRQMIDACALMLVDAGPLYRVRDELAARAELIGQGDGEAWLAQVPLQVTLISRAAQGLFTTADNYAARLKQAPDPAYLEPFRHVGTAYVRAAGASDLVKSGGQLLADADRAQNDVAVQMMNLLMARARLRLDTVDKGKKDRGLLRYDRLVYSGDLDARAALLRQREVQVRQRVLQLRELIETDPAGVIEMMDSLPNELEWLSFETELVFLVDRWESLIRLVNDNKDAFPDPRDPDGDPNAGGRGSWGSVAELLVKEGAGYGTLFKKVSKESDKFAALGQLDAQWKVGPPTAFRAELDGLEAKGNLNDWISHVLEFLKDEHHKKQVRELAKTVAFLALAWYAAPIAAAPIPAGEGAIAMAVPAFHAGRWLLSGPRAIAGRWAVGSNLAGQALHHGSDFDSYNFASLTSDYIFSLASHAFANGVEQAWGMYGKGIKGAKRWTNFGKQQAAFALYGYLLNTIRAKTANTKAGDQVTAGYVDSFLSMVKSVMFQKMRASPWGQALFPAGRDDPKYIALDKSISMIQKVTIATAFGVVANAGGKGPAFDEMPAMPDIDLPEFEFPPPDPSKPPLPAPPDL